MVDRLYFAALASTALIATLGAVPAHAQAAAGAQAQVILNLPEQELSKSLRDVARATNTNIIFDPRQTQGKHAPPLKGSYSAEEAINRLLANQSLVAGSTGTGTWVVSAEGNAASAAGAATDPQTAGQPGDRSADGPITVTGTRITGAAPIAQIIVATKKDIEESGRTSLADYMRTIPQVYLDLSGANQLSGLNSGITDLSFGSAASLRGLGAESTLTLLNGRRMAPSGGATFGAIADISGIPLGAIERVEIIPDGSSAIYGSDAMGGVVNIILRKSFNGVEAGGAYGFGRGAKPKNIRGSIAAGHSWNGGSILAVYERLELGNLRTVDRDFTSSRDLRPFGGTDFRSTFAQPGTVTAVDGNLNAVQNAMGLSTPVPFAALPAGSGRALTPGAVLPNVRNLQDVFPGSSIFPGDKRDSAWVSLDQNILGSVDVFATLMYSRRDVQATLGAISQTVNVPASNAFNPFGEAVRVSYNYETELGSEVGVRTLTAIAGTVGLRGRFGRAWSWDLALGHAQSRYRTSGPLELDTVAQAPLLASSDPNVAINVFGDGSGQNMASLRSVLHPRKERGKGLVQSGTAVVRGKLSSLDFGAGPLGLAFGLEHRRESQELISVSTRPGTPPPPIPFGGPTRRVSSAFAEARMPLFGAGNQRPGFQEMELSLAVREEHYSDFGNSLNPRVALLWRPFEWLAFRGAMSRSFRAPSLELLYGPASTSCCSPIPDPKRGGQVVGVTLEQSRNADLGPETSTAKALGMVWAPRRWSVDVSAEANYFKIEAKDRVISLASIPLVQAEDVIPPGLVIRDASGTLTKLVLKPFNSATDVSEGVDGRISFGSKTPIGYLRAELSGVYQLRLERQLVRGGVIVDNDENTGFSPKWKLRGGLSWRRGGFSVSSFLNKIPGSTNTTFRLPGNLLQHIKGWTTVDLSAAYDAGDRGSFATRGLRLSVSALNLFDRDPPFANGFLAYDPTRSDPRGRFVNFTVDKRF